LLQAADCFISLPDNPQEAFGYSVLEAMACGLPIIGADWDGLKETISPDVGIRVPTVWGPAMAGIDLLSPLYRAGEFTAMHLLVAQTVAVDMDAAFQALGHWAAHPGEARRLGMAARQRAERVYDWRTIIAQYVATWAAAGQVAAGAGPAPAGLQWFTAFERAFGHYPTHWLKTDSRVRRRLSVPLGPDRPVYGLQDRADGDLLGGILAATAESTCLADLTGRFTGHTAETVVAHVLWLLKYGWLEWVPADRP
jgi:hypothetical protein